MLLEAVYLLTLQVPFLAVDILERFRGHRRWLLTPSNPKLNSSNRYQSSPRYNSAVVPSWAHRRNAFKSFPLSGGLLRAWFAFKVFSRLRGPLDLRGIFTGGPSENEPEATRWTL